VKGDRKGIVGMRARFLTQVLILAGVAGILDLLALAVLHVSINTGPLFCGVAGTVSLAWGLWRRRHAQARLPWPPFVKRGLTVAIVVWAISLAVFVVLVLSAARDESERPVSHTIVLGAGLLGDRITATLLERLRIAAAYLQAHPDVIVIVSGGKGSDETRAEADAMADHLLSHGVAAERMVRERRSLSTWQNLRYSKDLLLADKGALPAVLIITSDFHVARAKFLARRLGFEAYGLPCPTPWYQYPNVLVREYFAFAKSWLVDRVPGGR
jgi:uncharacterized SAM-binding protein YcdF (DUF218 family)